MGHKAMAGQQVLSKTCSCAAAALQLRLCDDALGASQGRSPQDVPQGYEGAGDRGTLTHAVPALTTAAHTALVQKQSSAMRAQHHTL